MTFPKNKSRAAIFFDFDGTLINSSSLKLECFRSIFSYLDDSDFDAVDSILTENQGMPRSDKFTLIFKTVFDKKISRDELDDLSQEFDQNLSEVLDKPSFVDGSVDFLKKKFSTHDLFIISAAPKCEIQERLQQEGVLGLFKGVYGSLSDKSLKILEVLDSHSLSSDECFVIGDTFSDYQAASKTAIKFIQIGNHESLVDFDCLRAGDFLNMDIFFTP